MLSVYGPMVRGFVCRKEQRKNGIVVVVVVVVVCWGGGVANLKHESRHCRGFTRKRDSAIEKELSKISHLHQASRIV